MIVGKLACLEIACVISTRFHANLARFRSYFIKKFEMTIGKAKEAIEQFLKQSTDAEAAGDVRLADQLAERAYVLAKDLQNGK